MENSTTIAAEAEAPAESTIITEPAPGEQNQRMSRDAAINQAIEDMGIGDEGEEKPAEKPVPEAPKDTAKEPTKKPSEEKPEKDEGKPEEKETAKVEGEAPKEPKPEPRPDPTDRRPQAPARFMPDSKEVWSNVPRAVQCDIEVMVRDHETQLAKVNEGYQRYEEIRSYDEIARANGGDLSQTLARVAQIEDAMERNPIAALQRVLIEAGPRKADGTPLSLMEVAQHIVNAGPEAYQRMMQTPAPQQQQPQVNPEVQQLREQVAQMQQRQLEASLIEPFKAANPRYEELKGDIAFFLKSGRIPDSLSLHEKLAVAYDMAERINPSSHVEPPSLASPAPDRRADDFNGSRSIKGSPSGGVDRSKPSRKVSKDEAISLAMAEIFGAQG